MKRIKKFVDYDDLEFISESKVYFMNDLLLKLREIRDEENNEWASKLLKSQGKNIDADATFLNLDGENFSFSKEDDIIKVLSRQRMMGDEDIQDFFGNADKPGNISVNNYLGGYEQNHIKNLPNRGRLKMGRIIKKIIPEIPDKDLESLVNSLKSEQTGFEIKLVKGADIAKYYRKESCDRKFLNYGTLQSSCMMDVEAEKPHIFDIYTKNPESCQLAVMLNSSGQLVGRALVWKIDEISRWTGYSEERTIREDDYYSNFDVDWQEVKLEDNKNLVCSTTNCYYFSNSLLKSSVKDLYFMDRVYFTKEWIGNSFQKWAKENNFMIKIGNEISYKGKVGHPILSINVKKIAYRQFPYLDTFKYYDVQSSTLCNYEISNRGFSLNSTTGDYYPKGTNYQKKIDKATNYIRRFKDLF
jgi:hypothetical protein